MADDFAKQLSELDKSFEERIRKAKELQEQDRASGQQRAEQILADGSLGRVSETPVAGIDDLIAQRQALSQKAGDLNAADRELALRELSRVDQEFGQLIQDSSFNSAASNAERDAGKLAIQQAMKTQLRNIRGQANLGNVGPGGLPAGLVNDALGNATLARTQLELGLITDSRDRVNALTQARANARATTLGQLQQGTAQGIASQTTAQQGLQDSLVTRSNDLLTRQLTNLDARSRELFGRLAIEDTAVSQGIAERTGVRQQLLSEAQASDAAANAAESLEIQRIEANKPAPSGGKVLCTVLYEHGDLDLNTYLGDLAYADAYVDEDLRLGYYTWGVPLANYINVHKWARKLFKPLIKGWAQQMAYQMGEHKTGSWIGWAAQALSPACRLLGKTVRLLGYEDIVRAKAYPYEQSRSNIENFTLEVALLDLSCYDVGCTITEVSK